MYDCVQLCCPVYFQVPDSSVEQCFTTGNDFILFCIRLVKPPLHPICELSFNSTNYDPRSKHYSYWHLVTAYFTQRVKAMRRGTSENNTEYSRGLRNTKPATVLRETLWLLYES